MEKRHLNFYTLTQIKNGVIHLVRMQNFPKNEHFLPINFPYRLKCTFSFSTNKTDSSKYLKIMLRATVIEYYTIGRSCLGIKDLLLSRLTNYLQILMGDGIA